MDSDRELLELAAKAAGIPYIKPDPEYSGIYGLQAGSDNPMRCQSWNPLTDDGDALRLAVKLEIELWIGNGGTTAGGLTMDVDEEFGSDPYAATRRAIVRAAAEIGKAMP